LITENDHRKLLARRENIERFVDCVRGARLLPNPETNAVLDAAGCAPLQVPMGGQEWLGRREARIEVLQELGLAPPGGSDEVLREAETMLKYAGYVARQQVEVERLRRMEERPIPEDFPYDTVRGLRGESVERLLVVRPRTIGQAARIAGVLPSDISLLLVHLQRETRRATPAGTP
jgi:tRNA uridine 5-carboxymethylaminomethyl modification enzyme